MSVSRRAWTIGFRNLGDPAPSRKTDHQSHRAPGKVSIFGLGLGKDKVFPHRQGWGKGYGQEKKGISARTWLG